MTRRRIKDKARKRSILCLDDALLGSHTVCGFYTGNDTFIELL